MPKMENISSDVTDPAGDIGEERLSLSKIVFNCAASHSLRDYAVIRHSYGGAGDRPIACSYDTSIIQSMTLEQGPSCCPCQSRCRGV
jgi:hypothetical protein